MKCAAAIGELGGEPDAEDIDPSVPAQGGEAVASLVAQGGEGSPLRQGQQGCRRGGIFLQRKDGDLALRVDGKPVFQVFVEAETKDQRAGGRWPRSHLFAAGRLKQGDRDLDDEEEDGDHRGDHR